MVKGVGGHGHRPNSVHGAEPEEERQRADKSTAGGKDFDISIFLF
jgi:hypothetical protein